jgi:hypothetical protein
MPAQAAPRLIAVLDRAHDDPAVADAALARYAADGMDVEVVFLEDADTERTLRDLVAHIRRLRPQVVRAGRAVDDASVSALVGTAVARAADPRFGHICCSRGPYRVSRVEYLAAA